MPTEDDIRRAERAESACGVTNLYARKLEEYPPPEDKVRIIYALSIALAILALTACAQPSSPDAAKSIRISEPELVLCLGLNQYVHLWAEIEYRDGRISSDAINWSSSDSSIVEVDDRGRLVARGLGTAAISATAEDVRATANVTVLDIAVGMNVNETSIRFTLQEEGQVAPVQLTVEHVYGSGARSVPTAMTWRSDNESVAAVSPQGLVSPVGRGETVVTVDTNFGSRGVFVVVEDPRIGLELEFNEFTLEFGMQESYTLDVYDVLSSGTREPAVFVQWNSSNPSVATVTSKGLITAIGAGTAMITAEKDGHPATSVVTVLDPIIRFDLRSGNTHILDLALDWVGR